MRCRSSRTAPAMRSVILLGTFFAIDAGWILRRAEMPRQKLDGPRPRRIVGGAAIAFFRAVQVALERTVNLRCALEGRRQITSPGAKAVAGIIRHGGFKLRHGCSSEIDHAPAHAEADDADP